MIRLGGNGLTATEMNLKVSPEAKKDTMQQLVSQKPGLVSIKTS